MPIYEYYCDDCKKPFEVFVRTMKTPTQVACPDCGGEHVEKEVTAASALGMTTVGAGASAAACAPSG